MVEKVVFETRPVDERTTSTRPVHSVILPEAVQSELADHARALRSEMKRTAVSAVEAGRHLARVRQMLPHGQWGRWLQNEAHLSKRTAETLLTVYRVCGGWSSAELSAFAPSALYLLSAPHTPSRLLQQAREQAQQGTTVSHAEAQALKAAYRLAESQTRPEAPLRERCRTLLDQLPEATLAEVEAWLRQQL